ncbi:MAG: DUF2817 domain-containing protein [Spirochaetales bacterium]|nr:DUF2817 domain-containing protein [Spirochaetales bacterium]
MRIIILILICSLFQMTGCIKHNPDTNPERVLILNTDTASDKEVEPTGFPGLVQTYTIGVSVNGIPVTVTEIGKGEKTGLVIIGSIHGNEKNTGELVSFLESVYKNDHSQIPAFVRLFFVPVLNPDGLEKQTRTNTHNVDLNRNFPTDNWKSDAVSPSKIVPKSGGISPGSEPEVQAVIDWLIRKVMHTVDSVYLISFHAAYPPKGSVQPGYLEYGKPGPESEKFAQFISRESGYVYLSTWITSRELTGEFINWCEMNGIWSCDIELPDYNSPVKVSRGKKEAALETFKRTVQNILFRFLNDS